MLRIGFDAKRLFNNFTGLGNYSRTLVKNLETSYPENSYYLFTPKVKKNSETNYFLNSPNLDLVTPKMGPGAFWRSFTIKKNMKRKKLDLYHGLSHEIPFGVSRTGIKTVVTIHDLIFKFYPEQYGWIDRKLYDIKFKYACEHADRIVAISESTKKDIVKEYQVPAEKISVIYQSCHERFMQEKSDNIKASVLEKYKLPSEYLFYVGSIVERKNLLGIVQAMEKLPPKIDIPLVVVGNGGAYKNKVLQYIKQKQLQQRIHFIAPAFEDLPALYQQASIFIYPSHYEGFGIPILEALFSRTPVITSNTSSLPEAAGKNAYLINPDEPVQMAIGIEHILTDAAFRQTMIEQGYAHAQQFEGERLTQQMMELYEEVIEG
ncbi:MAG: glycosyltransferase family 4 protein [Saprospiraceae bacterium]|nr:glycosyltransferase family 4 protein [Saprospiraceae bacterium]